MKNVFSPPLPSKKIAVKFDIYFFNKYSFIIFISLLLFFYTKKLKFMRINIFFIFVRLNLADYVLKTIAKLKYSIRHEINQIPPKPKTPFTSKKLKI